MDEEKLNNDLKNRIREVFDSYEDTGAGAGWLLLREKFPVKEKERGLGWLWYAAAAVVLLFSAIWLLPNAGRDQQYSAGTKKAQPAIHQENTAPVPVDTANSPTRNTSQPAFAAAGITKSSKVWPSKNTPAPVRLPLTDYAATGSIHTTIITKADSAAKQPDITPATNVTVIAASKPNTLADSAVVKHNYFPYKKEPTLPSPDNRKNAYDQLFADRSATDNKDKAPLKRSDKKINISVYAATYFNYAKGSDNQVNLGAGFTSDFRITRKLKLSTGLAIAQNTLNYNNNNLPNPTQNEAAFTALAASAAMASGRPIIGNGTAQSMVRFATTLGGTKNYSASLVGLDIPVNLKFEFNPQKSDTYVAAGLSSGTFINETYRSVYTYSQVSQESATHNSFSGFDLAKTLNFSFGVGYPLGKNRLIVEPFVKYPLDGLGAQQLKFGASGVNLKLNFGPGRK